MRNSNLVCLLVLAASVAGGCGGDGGTGDAADDMAEDVFDVPEDDGVEAAPDDAAPDVPEVDMSEELDVEADAVEDVSVDEAGPDEIADAAEDGLGCEFMDLEWFLVRCTGGWIQLRHFMRVGGDPALCPEYYRLGDIDYSTLEAALAAGDCAASCLYRPRTAVMFEHCGSRMEYTVYAADDPSSCPTIYEFPDGIFYSPAAWESVHPCP
jgi:hypothetical protein